MDEIKRILAKAAHERTKEELEYLHAHKEELDEKQLQQLSGEPAITTTSFDVNKIKVVEKDDDTVMFSRPLTITDNTEQFNGTKYDIPTMDMGDYRQHITIDHGWSIHDIVGNIIGLSKAKSKVTIDGIKFAVKENAEAIFAKAMLLGGFVTDFSIETVGPWPNDDGVYENSKLIGLSMVIAGNNKSATVNQIVRNSIAQAKENGLDTTELEKTLDKVDSVDNNVDDMKFKTIKNSRNFAVTLAYKNSAGESVEILLQPGQSIEVVDNDTNTGVENQITDAKDPEAKTDNDVATIVKNAIESATKPLVDKVTELEQKIFDNGAREPEFKQGGGGSNNNGGTKKYADMDYKERHALQINAAWEMLKNKDMSQGQVLREINKVNLEALQAAGKVNNSMTIADFGSFVISPELLTEIEGHRSDFQPLLARFPFLNTLSLETAWLKRSGDINMQEVEFCDDGADGNLKPISEYEATFQKTALMELAAVTPVCDAATRFLAVDMLGDIAGGYRTDFDRKRAQLVIARLQQAVNATGNKKAYNLAAASVLNPLNSLIDAASSIAELIDSGLWIFNTKTYWEFVRRRRAEGSAQNDAFALFTTGDAGPLFLGFPYIVVPNELMPSLNTGVGIETKSFAVEGASVSIDQGLFFVDPQSWIGRTSGGLKYDLSTDAAYEVNGVVKSAFQRNELVLRGSFFRGGAIKNTDKVASLGAAAIS